MPSKPNHPFSEKEVAEAIANHRRKMHFRTDDGSTLSMEEIPPVYRREKFLWPVPKELIAKTRKESK